MKHILPIVFFTFFASAAFSQNTYYFTVKFPDDKTVTGCGTASADTTWPIISNTPNCLFGVGVSVKDQVFMTGTGSCGKILRRWRLLYWCDYDPNWGYPNVVYNPSNTDEGPTVIGNSQNHGYLEYTQVIKIMDGGSPKFIGCPTGLTFCDYSTNDPTQYNKNHMDLCEGVVNLTTKVTDLCSKANVMLTYRLWLDLDANGTAETYLSSSDNLAWPIETTVVADTLRGRVKFPAGVGLPYGKHMIEWIAQDGCGNQSLCKYPFTVKDCSPPTVLCYNGLSANIMETGMITVWATDFVKKKWDNCVHENQIKVAVRKKGTGTGFPTFGGSVTFNCDELGEQPVEVWASDTYGNASFCETYLDVQDPFGSCQKPAPGTTNRTEGEKTGNIAQVKPAMPNPSNGVSTFDFYLPENGGEVKVEVFEVSGKMLQSSKTAYPEGWHRAEIDLRNAQTSGVFLLKIEYSGQVWTQRLVLMP